MLAGQIMEVACRVFFSWVWCSESSSRGIILGVGKVRESKAIQQSEGDFQELGEGAWPLAPVISSFSVTWRKTGA